MPHRHDLDSILVIGSGPIVIGQACEFDYSGTQAVRALRAAGYRVILVNSNPATIMTDPDLADATYVEPITAEVVTAIIAEERPDALLPTLGGQTALNVTVDLAELGVLDRYLVEVIGAGLEAIAAAEDRGRFKSLMESAGIATAAAGTASTEEGALAIAADLGYPVMVRPSYILGGGGTGLAADPAELRRVAETGLASSPVGEVLVEESIAGWKEFELEVMADGAGNAVVVCSIENLDPMGVHTGDSITVAPQMTLSDREYQAMRTDAITCLRLVGVATGGSNVQFAVEPATGRRVMVEMNPRVSRSSALASKATGFPIAKIAALLAVGYTLDEIRNDITGATPASFEPALDYVVVKAPRFDFAKFPSQPPLLGTSMQSVGEAMAIGRTFPEALQKALRSLEIGRAGLGADPAEAETAAMGTVDLLANVALATPQRVFLAAEALRRGVPVGEVAERTGYDRWFVAEMASIVAMRKELEGGGGADSATVRAAKRLGFSDRQIAHVTGQAPAEVTASRVAAGITVTYKTVDTCAAEFEAATPYFYGTYETEDEAPPPKSNTVVVLGSGPNRIGQGIEFDYCCVHASFALAERGFEPVMINCNPETVSTDYDTSARLYFEPLTTEDVLAVLDREKPLAVVVQLGGQTPLGLAPAIADAGFAIAGTTPDAIALAEDRERFARLCQRLDIPQPASGVARTVEAAARVAAAIGYPVLVRPSFVLGGRAMRIVADEPELRRHLGEVYRRGGGEVDLAAAPLLVDRFLDGAIEVDVDAVCDGSEVYLGGVMEHVEEAGIHSGDSACVVPPQTLSDAEIDRIAELTHRLALGLGVRGLVNIQFAVSHGQVVVLEANPRASRTVPFLSKATGIPLAKVATRVMMGETLADLRRTWVLAADPPSSLGVAIKAPVLPWKRFLAEDRVLGPEMRATGEVMGLAPTVGGAYAKALSGAGQSIPRAGTVFLSLDDRDKPAAASLAADLIGLGFRVLATHGTAGVLARNGVEVTHVDKVGDGPYDPVRLIELGEIDLVINTPGGARARSDAGFIRRAATRHDVPCVTTVRGGRLLVESLRDPGEAVAVTSLQRHHLLQAGVGVR
ncbi:MAG: carbamoyl-phosphate synthase large subunit [Acidimicrobiia bacterium]|nr:carbamoyl-phosphate synthase large subunit [Acidimicrobiia bacterium]